MLELLVPILLTYRDSWPQLYSNVKSKALHVILKLARFLVRWVYHIHVIPITVSKELKLIRCGSLSIYSLNMDN